MDRSRKISYTVLSISLAGMLICLCIFLRHSVLACHDSLADMVYARTETAGQSYKRAMDFCLARGRVGFIFPLVVTFRQIVNGHGNYASVWMLQHLPIMADVILVSWIIYKKTSPIYGMFFGMCFMGFLQVNVWHSLIDCYPLDFMYGLFISVLALWFFQKHLEKPGDKRFIILSVFLFYESMQAYEPFLFACFVYALLAFFNARARKEKKIKTFIGSLIPHVVTSAVFLGILIFLRRHPVVIEDVTPIDSYGTAEGFIKTWYTFSIGMFPLTHIRNVGFSSWLFTPDSMKGHIPFVIFSTVSMILSVILMFGSYRKAAPEKRKKTDRSLVVLGLSGLLYAVFFPLSHALTENYQKWVTEGEAGGYVPTAISYYGWILFLSCIACFVVNKIASGNRRYLRTAALIFAAFAFFFGSHFTSVINEYFRDEYASTGASVSSKAEAFYDMIEDVAGSGIHYDVIYVPDYMGINGDIEMNERFAESVLGYDIEIVNEEDEFESYLQQGARAAEFDYKEEDRQGVFGEVG